MRLRFLIVVSVALSSLGCAEQLQLLDRGPVGGVSPCSFWPPPPSSTTWLAEPSQSPHPSSLGFVARELELSLREGGYSQQRWYPIGMGQSHGFAVTTRLEQLEEDGRPSPSARWSSLYAEAANLRWLMQARRPRLPHPGHYRALLLAYTDLPIDKTANAPIWNQETIMDWPDAPHASAPADVPVSALARSGYRLAIYEYQYRSSDTDDRGKLLPRLTEAAGGKSPPLAAPLEAHGFMPRAAEQF